ncbi:hypothetical protein scyTo_0023409 [Scyliorhinus torazame]|uniref:Uncharacterized protein n=1 Tax=Scyliorhinus torazame TaxID=75743 RepID=A0A401QCI3_SCYTO|nr:hypothetical protein [Scyliorhinus torazame]
MGRMDYFCTVIQSDAEEASCVEGAGQGPQLGGNRGQTAGLQAGAEDQRDPPCQQPPNGDGSTADLLPAVSTLPEARCQQAADNVTEEEEIQESNHPGLQNPGSRPDQHG